MMAQGGTVGLGAFGAASPAIRRLQNALNALAQATGDHGLAVKADGLAGPGTASATNRAMVSYVTNGPSTLRTGRLTAKQLPALAAALASNIENEAARRRGKGAAVPGAKAATRAPAKVVVATAPPTKVDVRRLQVALAALGARVGDRTLAAVKADGIMGPRTAAAANLALSKFTPNAAAGLRTGKLSTGQITSQAGAIAMMIEASTKTGAAVGPTAASPAASANDLRDLQQALIALGARFRDKILAVKADGKMGPKTAAAVNRALVQYVPTAPLELRSGRLTPAQILFQVSPIKAVVVATVNQRSGLAPGAFGPPSPPIPKTGSQVKDLQLAIAALSRVVKDTSLAIKADGAIGPKTVAATNKALKSYARAAPARFRTGKLTTVDVRNQADIFAKILNDEIAGRGANPASAAAAAANAGALPPAEAAVIAEKAAAGTEPADDSAPANIPGPKPAILAPDSGGGGGGASSGGGGGGGIPSSGGGGGGMPDPEAAGDIPAPPPAPGEEAPAPPPPPTSTFPTIPVLIGAGVLAFGLTLFLASGSSSSSPPSASPRRSYRSYRLPAARRAT
jgi:lysozyme family protein